MHNDDAFDHLVRFLARLAEWPADRPASHERRPYGCDVWVPSVAWDFWRSRLTVHEGNTLQESHLSPFYDAAWDLCRLGVLRPGEFAPRGQSINKGFSGDGYSVTAFGRQWLLDAVQRPTSDPGRLAEILQGFAKRFGDGYQQRAAEAVRCYRTTNYLASCAMAGAAAESILLAVAIAKMGDEHKVLAEYHSSGGRNRTKRRIVGNVAQGLATQFESATQILHYWRDDASHGTFTTISEIEAHTSLSQLLRLAQLASDHWPRLTI
jgi:hypothetical protein